MPIPSPSYRLRQKTNLKRYLIELAALVGRPIHTDELSGLEQVASIQGRGQKFVAQPSRGCEVPFADRCSSRFADFLQKLHNANPSPVYIWTPRTASCGAFLVPSLAAIKFDFDFSINEEGMLVFLSGDLEDRLILDFSNGSEGEQRMKIETQGRNWAGVAY